jgi:hypothetical protein
VKTSLLALLLGPPLAVAQETAPVATSTVESDTLPETEDDEDIWKLLDELPARVAWEGAMHASYGNVGYWSGANTPWVGLGGRAGYGVIFKAKNRLGGAMGASLEGEFPIYATAAFEPQITLDRVSGGLQLGLSVGPSLLVHTSQATVHTETVAGLASMAAFRIGYSKSYSRLGRRFFVVLEPKIRILKPRDPAASPVDWLVAIVVGSGRGR